MGTKASEASPFFKVQIGSQGLTPQVLEAQEVRGRCSHGSPGRRGQCGANRGHEPTFSHRRPYKKNGVGSTPMWPNWEPGVTSLRFCPAPSRTQRMQPEERQGKMAGRSLRPGLTSRPRAEPGSQRGAELRSRRRRPYLYSWAWRQRLAGSVWDRTQAGGRNGGDSDGRRREVRTTKTVREVGKRAQERLVTRACKSRPCPRSAVANGVAAAGGASPRPPPPPPTPPAGPSLLRL